MVSVFYRFVGILSFLLLVLGIFFPEPLFASHFSDTAGHKYEDAIEFLAELGVVNGNPDGTFRPDNPVNRAEIVKIVMEGNFEGPFEAKSCFPDVVLSEWFSKYVCAGKFYQIVKGYDDGYYRPAQTVNFVESVKILFLSYNILYEESDPWYKKSVEKAAEMNIIPLDVKAFDTPFTRGQMSEMLARLINYKLGTLDDFLGEKTSWRVTYDTILEGRDPEFDPDGGSGGQIEDPNDALSGDDSFDNPNDTSSNEDSLYDDSPEEDSSDSGVDGDSGVGSSFGKASDLSEIVSTRTFNVPLNKKTNEGSLQANITISIKGYLEEVNPASFEATRYSDRAFQFSDSTVEWSIEAVLNDAGIKCNYIYEVTGHDMDAIENLNIYDGVALDTYDLKLKYLSTGLDGIPQLSFVGSLIIPVDVTETIIVTQSSPNVTIKCSGYEETTTVVHQDTSIFTLPFKLKNIDLTDKTVSDEFYVTEPYGNEWTGEISQHSGDTVDIENTGTILILPSVITMLGDDGPWSVSWTLNFPD